MNRGSAPIIAVTMGTAQGSGPLRSVVNAAYLRAVQGAGGIPLPLSPHLDAETIDALFERCAALVLTGGGDVDPGCYGTRPHPTVTGVDRVRDDAELSLTRLALERSMPVLAICRGMQVVNVALGGSLIQDIPSCVAGALAHAQEASRESPTHAVQVSGGSRLGDILGDTALEVNSMHHQALDRLGNGVQVVARAPDGVIEGIELEGMPNVVGVQWHPEELVTGCEHARRLFAWVVATAGERG